MKRKEGPCRNLVVARVSVDRAHVGGTGFRRRGGCHRHAAAAARAVEAKAKPFAPCQVVAAELTGSTRIYKGACPVKIKFSGVVKVVGSITANHPCTVNYIFTRSDGAIDTVVKSLTFTAPGRSRSPRRGPSAERSCRTTPGGKRSRPCPRTSSSRPTATSRSPASRGGSGPEEHRRPEIDCAIAPDSLAEGRGHARPP